MSSLSLRMFTDVVLHLILVATVFQQNVVYAQSHGDPYYSMYYWFSPGRIVGIAVGVALFLILILSLLITAYCRRRKRARAVSNVTVPTYYPAADVQPRPHPSWQQPQMPYYGPYADPGWPYSAPAGTAPAPYGQAKLAPPPRDVRGAAPPEHTSSSSDGRRITPSDLVRKPSPTNQAQRPAPPGQVRRPASTSQVQSTLPPAQAQSSASLGPAQNVAPSEGAPSASSPVRAQEPVPPRPAYAKPTQSASGINGREPSPPPYSPPAGPLEPSTAHGAR